MYYKVKKASTLHTELLSIAFRIFQINGDTVKALEPTGCTQYGFVRPISMWHGSSVDIQLIFKDKTPNPDFEYLVKRKNDKGYRLKTRSKSKLTSKVVEDLRKIDSISTKDFNDLFNYDPYASTGNRIMFYPQYLPVNDNVYIGFRDYVMSTYTPHPDLIEVLHSEYLQAENYDGQYTDTLSAYFMEACIFLCSRKHVSLNNLINRLKIPTFEAMAIGYDFLEHGLARYNKNTGNFDVVDRSIGDYIDKVDKIMSNYYAIEELIGKDKEALNKPNTPSQA